MDKNGDPVWDRVLEKLKELVTRPAFETWLKDTMCIAMGKGEVYVAAPNQFVAEMLEHRMYSLVSSTLEDVLDRKVDVEFVTMVPDESLTEIGQTG